MSRKKKYLTTLPVARIKKIMQLDEEVGKVAVASPFLIAKALEKFLTGLIDAACTKAIAHQHKRLQPRHLKEVIISTKELEFLTHVVEKIQIIQEEASSETIPFNVSPVDKPAKRKITLPTSSPRKLTALDGEDAVSRGKRGRPKKIQPNILPIDPLNSKSAEITMGLESMPIPAPLISYSSHIGMSIDETDYD